MSEFDPIRHNAATAVFKLALKVNGKAVHRTIDRDPKGKGWVQCENAQKGILCKPDKVLESIEYFKIAYEVFPDIVALNQIAISYGMVGDNEKSAYYYGLMKEQAENEGNSIYEQTASLGLLAKNT